MALKKPYTKKVQINYVQGEKQPVTVEWTQNSGFQTGNYKIEIYNNGFKIGEGVRSFKKGGLIWITKALNKSYLNDKKLSA